MRLYVNVSPGFFDSLGIRIEAGRDLTWTDIYGGRKFVLVSENLARELFGSATDVNKAPRAPTWPRTKAPDSRRPDGDRSRRSETIPLPAPTGQEASDSTIGPGASEAMAERAGACRGLSCHSRPSGIWLSR